MMGDTLKTGGLLLIIPFFMLSGLKFSDPVTQPRNTCREDSVKRTDLFGMRMRMLKPGVNVFAPAFIGEAPGNEATVVRLQDGVLKIFFINRPGSADKLMSTASRDNGLSWEAPHVEFTLPGQAYYANQVILGMDKELHCVFHIFDTGDNGYRNRHLNLWYCKTENKQQRWTQPQKIYDGYVGSIRGFIQPGNGKLLMAFARAVPAREKKPEPGVIDYGWNEIISLDSDNNGHTWQTSDNTVTIAIDGSMVTRYGAVEPSIIELEDERIWMLIRTTKGYLYESFSHNAGRSWQTPQRTKFISSDSPAGILRLSDNRIVLFWSGNQRWDDPRSYAVGGREVLHAAISRDEGRTWKGFREVLSAPTQKAVAQGDRGTAYPSAVETADGKVALVSGQGEAKSIVLFDPDWLAQSSASDDFSEGLAQWTFYDADSLTNLTRSSAGDKDVLHIRKAAHKKNSDTEAVWNFPMTTRGELKAEIELKSGHKGIFLALTDHFSIAGDTLASENAVVNFLLDKNIHKTIRKNENRLSVKMTWDINEGTASLFLNDKVLSEKKFSRRPFFGLNYLRIGIPGTGEDLTGFLLHSVKVTDMDQAR